jgi:hypothetical protein
LDLKSGIVMVGLYFQVWILEESRPLTIFEMPWVDEFLGSLAYIFKFIFVGLWSHIICVQATFELCWLILILLFSGCVFQGVTRKLADSSWMCHTYWSWT